MPMLKIKPDRSKRIKTPTEIGKETESCAAKLYASQGFRILCRNYRCRHGEIDIIARRGIYVHFIEVKARSRMCYGRPADAVDSLKRKRLLWSANEYISRHASALREVQYYLFDIVEMDLRSGSIRVLPNAFGWSK